MISTTTKIVCDRCGKEILKPFQENLDLHENLKESIQLISDDINRRFNEDPGIIPENEMIVKVHVDEVNENGAFINLGITRNKKHYDLCPKCKRAFKKFMKGE